MPGGARPSPGARRPVPRGEGWDASVQEVDTAAALTEPAQAHPNSQLSCGAICGMTPSGAKVIRPTTTIVARARRAATPSKDWAASLETTKIERWVQRSRVERTPGCEYAV
jgi:hypothetical protein